MKAKINFIFDVIIQLLVLICVILLVISNFELPTMLFLIVVLLFFIRDIEAVVENFKTIFLNKKE